MPRINLDIDFLSHPKIIQLDPLAELLFIRCTLYAAKYLTDGFVPNAALALLSYNFDTRYYLSGYTSADSRTVDDLVVELVENQLFHPAKGGGWMIHDYLDYQLSKAEVEEVRKKKRESGQAGGRASAQARAQAGAKAKSKHEASKAASEMSTDFNPNPNPNPNPMTKTLKKKKEKTPPTHVGLPALDEFQQIWESYPRKVGKQAAIKAWMKLNGSRPDLSVVLVAVEKYKRSQGWLKDSGEFIPHLSTFLNGKRWEDVIVEVSTSVRPDPPPGRHDPIARGLWKQTYGDPKQYGYN